MRTPHLIMVASGKWSYKQPGCSPPGKRFLPKAPCADNPWERGLCFSQNRSNNVLNRELGEMERYSDTIKHAPSASNFCHFFIAPFSSATLRFRPSRRKTVLFSHLHPMLSLLFLFQVRESGRFTLSSHTLTIMYTFTKLLPGYVCVYKQPQDTEIKSCIV